VGRRSRKRGDGIAPAKTTRAERDAARRVRPSQPPRKRGERPPAPWGNFPLSELVILIGIVLILWGALSGEDGEERLFAGLVIASLGGGELALREHLAGYRSHSSLLGGVAAFVVVSVVALTLGPVNVLVLVGLGVATFVLTFFAMRELFRRRSGGLSFR
jgi:hypothetical protein